MAGFTAVDRLILSLEMKDRNMNKGFKDIDNILDDLDKKIKKTTKSTKGFNTELMGFGMAMLFTGMALKNFAQGAIRALGNSFMLLADEQNAGVKRTLELQAATQFLKFVLFDTFANTDMYGNFVEFIVNAANRLSEFAQQHPNLVKLFFAFLAVGVVIGAIAMVLGQLALLALGLGIGLFSLIGIIIALALTFALMFTIWTNKATTTKDKILASLFAILLGIMVVAAAFGLWPLALIAAVLAAVVALHMMRDQIDNIWKQIGLKILLRMSKLKVKWIFWVNDLGKAFIDKLTPVVDMINKMIAAFNKLTGRNIATIDLAGVKDKFRRKNLEAINAELDKQIVLTDRINKLVDEKIAMGTSGEFLMGKLGISNRGLVGTNPSANEDSSINQMIGHQAQAAELLGSMKTEGININDDGVSRMSKAMGVEVSKEMLNTAFTEIMPSTER